MIGIIQFWPESLEGNHPAAQRKTGNSRNRPDLSAGNPFVAGFEAPAPRQRPFFKITCVESSFIHRLCGPYDPAALPLACERGRGSCSGPESWTPSSATGSCASGNLYIAILRRSVSPHPHSGVPVVESPSLLSDETVWALARSTTRTARPLTRRWHQLKARGLRRW